MVSNNNESSERKNIMQGGCILRLKCSSKRIKAEISFKIVLKKV